MRFLFAHYNQLPPSSITQQNIIDYICFIIREHRVGREKCHQVAQSCSFFYQHVFPSAYVNPTAFFPRRVQKLPPIFSVDQIQQLLGVVTNQKHLMMISLMYGSGLRLNELRKLKILDIDGSSYQIKVTAGKGGKDRFTILPRNLLTPLREYYKNRKPLVYLFEGQTPGLPMSEYSIQHCIQVNLAKIGLKGRHFSAKALRHSFATHLLDTGTDIFMIKELLGHNHFATTMVYLHLQQSKRQSIISPFDTIMHTNE